ncbi:hypothetical protein Tco_1036499 [Tanacetum coccineum]
MSISLFSAVTAGVSDTVIAVRDKLRGKIGQTKVKRYWPGKAPEWADDGDEDADIRTSKAALESVFPSRDDGGGRNHIVKGNDHRLRRLAENRLDNKEEVRADHRRIRQAKIISSEEEEQRRLERLEFKEDDKDAVDEKRRRIREKLLQREQEEAEAAKMVEEEEEDEEDEEEEEKRKVEKEQIVVEEIRMDIEVQNNLEAEADVADVETDDDLNNADEYEAWKAHDPDDTAGTAGTAGADGVYRRDYSSPTGEDKMDKTILPKVM